MQNIDFSLLVYMVIPFQEEKDDNYEEEAEVADVFDSDFDEDVSNCFMDLKMKSICQICFLILLHFWLSGT